MCVARLRDRVPSAKPIGTYKLDGHKLCFHKFSEKDKSGKCDAHKTDNCSDFVMGRLFNIKESEKGDLNKHEGLKKEVTGKEKGYYEKLVTVVDADGNVERAFTYYACPESIDKRLRPTKRYKEYVLAEAKEAPLPSDYIRNIEAIMTEEGKD